MRSHFGCVAAALFSVPVFSAPLPPQGASYTEIVTLPLPVGDDGIDIRTLQLDVEAKFDGSACIASDLVINGQLLTRDHDGAGSGILSLSKDDIALFDATWSYDCYPDDAQFIHIELDKFNGDQLGGEVRFDIKIIRPSGNEDQSISVAVTPESLKPGFQYDDIQNLPKVENGGSEETFFNIATEPHRQATLKSQDDLIIDIQQSEKPAKAVLKEVVNRDFIYGAIFATLSISVIAAVFMSCLFCCTNYGAAIRQRMKERKQSRREKKAAARAARREARRQAVSEFFNSIFSKRSREDESEEKRAMIEDSDSSDDDASTVTDELVGLRTVADMVGDIVAAEEGRTQASAAPPFEHRHPDFNGRSTPDFYDDDESLPAYEEQAPGAAMVADGFQYQGQAPMMSENSSDRLGYDK